MSKNMEIARLSYQSLNKEEQAEFIRMCGIQSNSSQEKFTGIMRREEVAKLAGRTLRAVDKWAEQGLLKRVKLPGRKKAIGFRESDVRALLGVDDDCE